MNESELATEAEIAETLDQARRELADKAKHEILQGESQGVHSLVDLYDSEIEKITLIVSELNARIMEAHTLDRDALNDEIIERMAGIGLAVEMKWYYSQVPGVYIPEIQINGRTEAIEFDHDRQVHEVTNDYLGLGEEGTVGGSGLWTPGS